MTLSTRLGRVLMDYPGDSVRRDFDTMVNRLFTRDAGELAIYPVDIHEDADQLYVDAELPGFKKEEVEITLENSNLTISAERKPVAPAEGADQKSPLLTERRYSRVLRSFTLPPTFDEGSVQAKLEDGVLHITLKRREETKPRKITVN